MDIATLGSNAKEYLLLNYSSSIVYKSIKLSLLKHKKKS